MAVLEVILDVIGNKAVGEAVGFLSENSGYSGGGAPGAADVAVDIRESDTII